METARTVALPLNNLTPPIPNMASAPEEMEALIQDAKVRLDEVRGQQAFYIPLDWFDVDIKQERYYGRNNI